jgi:hypothetical protein
MKDFTIQSPSYIVLPIIIPLLLTIGNVIRPADFASIVIITTHIAQHNHGLLDELNGRLLFQPNASSVYQPDQREHLLEPSRQQ